MNLFLLVFSIVSCARSSPFSAYADGWKNDLQSAIVDQNSDTVLFNSSSSSTPNDTAFSQQPDVERMEILDAFEAGDSKDLQENSSNTIKRVSKALLFKRQEIHGKLLDLYRQQVDPCAVRIYWEKVKVSNFPLKKDRKYYSSWSQKEMDKLESRMAYIKFKMHPPVKRTAKPRTSKEKETKLRTRAINTSLLQVYREQINPSAKIIPWSKVNVLNFPPNLLAKRAPFWTLHELDLVEACLPNVRFQRIKTNTPNEDLSIRNRKRELKDLDSASESSKSRKLDLGSSNSSSVGTHIDPFSTTYEDTLMNEPLFDSSFEADDFEELETENSFDILSLKEISKIWDSSLD